MNRSPASVIVDSFECRNETVEQSMTKTSTTTQNNVDDANGGIQNARNAIFELAGLVGELSALFLRKVPLDPPFTSLEPANSTEIQAPNAGFDDEEPFSVSRPNEIKDQEVTRAVAKVLLKLVELAHMLSLNVGTVVRKKMKLNAQKYPVGLCRGKAGKYTEYSSQTGITKDQGQSTLHMEDEEDEEETAEAFLNSVDRLIQDVAEFATARQWTRYHTPRNILLALLGELGELAEIFQWRGDCTRVDSIKKEDMDKIGQEIADCTIYILRLCDVSNIEVRVQAMAVLESSD